MACGGQDAEQSEPAAATPDQGVGENGAVIEDVMPSELAMADGVLRLALERPDSYLPTDVALTDQSAVIVSDLLYDGLTEAVGVEGRLRPGLAEAWWHNEDYTVWTFAIDPAAEVDVESVVNSLLPFSSEPTGDTAGPGVAARLAAGIRTVTASSVATVSVELERPNAGLPWVLSGLPFSIVGPAGQPTGSYRIASDDAAGLRLTARLVQDEDVRPIRIEWGSDRAGGYQKLVDGKLDGALVPAEQIDEATTSFAVGPEASVSTRFYVLHLGSARLADPALRDLTRAAIDPTALAADTFDQQVTAADGLMPQTMAGYRPNPCQDCEGQVAVAPAAADALAAFGPLEVAYSGADQQATAAAIVAQLVAAGIPAVEQPMDPDALAAVIVSGGTDIFSFGWVAAATSSDAILPVLLSAESPANVARIGSTEIDRILAAAAVTADDEARWDLHHQAHQAALSSGRLIPIAAGRTSLALADDAGAVAVRADGSIDLNAEE